MADILDHRAGAAKCIDGPALARGLGFCDVTTPISTTRIIARQITLADYLGMQSAFDDLATRAELANPFMSPALVGAAAVAVDPRHIVVLTVTDSADPDRLLGAWCLRRQRDIWSGGCEVLQVPIMPRYECLASPVVDKDTAEAALQAMLAHVASSTTLPSIIRATSWPLAMNRLVPANVQVSPAETWTRAVMYSGSAQDAETYLKRTLGKALNKRNNRQKQLAGQGELRISTVRGADASAALEHYVRLEAQGWKGGAGTSLAEVPADAAYMRAAIAALSEVDQVSVDMIELDGVPIAAGVVVEAGGNNLFWKAAFDEGFSRYAPGSLLHLAVTRRLFAMGKAQLDSGMMEFTTPAHMPWSERAEMARVVIAGRANAPAMLVRAGSWVRHALRRIRNRLSER